MEQRGTTTNPYFKASQPTENHLLHRSGQPLWPERVPEETLFSDYSPSLFDDRTLALAISRLSLSSTNNSQTLPFRPTTPAGVGLPPPEADSYMGSLYSQLYLRDNNVALMRAQSGVFNDRVGLFSGPHRDFRVGPGPGGNFRAAAAGSVLDFTEPSSYYEDSRFNVEMLNQRGYGYEPSYGYYDHDPFLQYKKQMASKINTHYPILAEDDFGYDALMDRLLSNNSNFIRPNSYNNKNLSQWNQQISMSSIEDLRGMIVSLAKDQNGSKVLQTKIAEANEENVELVVLEVIGYMGDLLKNQSGSFFFQKLFSVCNEQQRTKIIVALTSTSFQLIGICLNPHGARSIQKLLENLITPQQISLVMSALSPGAVALANDPNGHHVIQYCVLHFPYEYIKHLLNEIAKNCFRIATDKSGCCVLQTCVERSHGELKECLINDIIANAVHLAEDQYGNYVVQHLLGLMLSSVTPNLLRRLQGNFVSLSCNKYASNVVEKFLNESGEENARTIMKELLTSKNPVMLLMDQYGNYVIQTALSVSKNKQGEVYDDLVHLIELNAPLLKRHDYGKKVLAWFDNNKVPLGINKQK